MTAIPLTMNIIKPNRVIILIGLIDKLIIPSIARANIFFKSNGFDLPVVPLVYNKHMYFYIQSKGSYHAEKY